MRSLFEPYIQEMAEFCIGRRADNQCLFGIDSEGKLFKDENCGAHGASLAGDWQEQIQFRGGATWAEIEARVAQTSYWLEKA